MSAKVLAMDVYKLPIVASLGIIAAILAGTVLLSLLKTRQTG